MLKSLKYDFSDAEPFEEYHFHICIEKVLYKRKIYKLHFMGNDTYLLGCNKYRCSFSEYYHSSLWRFRKRYAVVIRYS